MGVSIEFEAQTERKREKSEEEKLSCKMKNKRDDDSANRRRHLNVVPPKAGAGTKNSPPEIDKAHLPALSRTKRKYVWRGMSQKGNAPAAKLKAPISVKEI